MELERSRFANVLEVARDAAAYDELPVLAAGIDPQLHVSRNDRAQPFFLLCEHDTLLVQLAGRASLALRHPAVRRFELEPGDFVYVPAGTPHQILPITESVHARFKPEHAGLEAVAWYCPRCERELRRDEWDTARELPQEAYARVCEAFNSEQSARRCKDCGAEHPRVALDGIRWREVAAAIRAASTASAASGETHPHEAAAGRYP